jgi:hypothetical protein
MHTEHASAGSRKRRLPQASTVLALALCFGMLGVVSDRVAQAVQLSDGKVYFTRPPEFIEAITYYKNTGALSATYYFTLRVPADAGEPLRRVTLAQTEGVDAIRFILNQTTAYEGKNDKSLFTLGEVTEDRKQRTVSITFDPPIPPGKLITIAMRPIRNPLTSGVYMFGVTAYPPGEKVHGQFLGYGRLHFYNNGFFRAFPSF